MAVEFADAPALPRWLAPHVPFRRRIARIAGRRVHFIDHGEGPVVLLCHGNPTWCFLWRKVIAALGTGVRVIAPDLLGLGLSDKPRSPDEHSLRLHLDAIGGLVDALDLPGFVSVGQDWGGPVAAGVAHAHASRVRGLVFGNTAVLAPRRPLRTTSFHRASRVPMVSDLLFRVGGFPLPVLSRVQGDRASIGALERRAYRWPLRRLRDRSAPLGLARMVPDHERHPTLALMEEIGAWVESFEGPSALVWGSRDPILGRALKRHAQALPQALVIRTHAGHFLQEEVPHEFARAIRHTLSRGLRP